MKRREPSSRGTAPIGPPATTGIASMAAAVIPRPDRPRGMRTRPSWMALLAIATVLAGCASTDDDTQDDDVLAILEQREAAQREAIKARPPELPPVSSPASLRAGQRLPHFTSQTWQQVPAWQADDYRVVWQALLRNCEAVLRRGLGRPGSGSAVAAARPWLEPCRDAFNPELAPDPHQADEVRQFLEARLQPWLVIESGRAASNTVTGYYEPLVEASRERGGDFQWPLYAVPQDMLVIDLGEAYPELRGKRIRGKVDGNRVVPYPTRAEIDAAEQPPDAIVWVNDPVDAFFLQVQGSGRARLIEGPDAGSIIRLAYADQNGHGYQSIGRWLVDQGELTLAEASMQSIRAWARRNPERVREMLNVNPSVVFFREEAVAEAGEGPRGAFGVPLTARHSIAVDPDFVPLGSPVLLDTTCPGSQEPLRRLVFAQDTGSAIRGAARADFFWGFGDEAGQLAGRMKQPGRMWVLWPKGAGSPATDR